MRKIVMNILMKYKEDHSYLNLSLNHALKNSHLSSQDADLVTKIVYGTVQNEIYLDYQLQPFVRGKLKLFDQMVLKMSLYQLIFLDKIPNYAIINEAVAMIKNKGGLYRSKVANAILREFERVGTRDIEGDELEVLSIQTSTPLWMVKMLSKQLGFEACKQSLNAMQEVPHLSARVNTLKTSKEQLLKDYPLTPGLLSKDAVIFNSGNIAHTKLYQEGLVTIQDESSQMVALLLNPSQNSKVLDMCSAPGSKTTHLSAIMQNTGEIHAFDLHEHKIKLINDNAKRLNATNIKAKAYDSTQLLDLYAPESFDYILLDGPCSGLGVMGRKPEIKYQSSNNMDGIIKLQQQLLDTAYELLKPNGILVYSTCTINKKENELQVNQFLSKFNTMRKIEERLILPYEYHSDGFYMCKMQKENI